MISDFVKTCVKCQKFKITAEKKYGELPLKDNICVAPSYHIYLDCVRPWKIIVTDPDRKKRT